VLATYRLTLGERAFAAGLREGLQPRSDIDAVSEDVFALGDHVA
jgi:hypothetical protein